MSGAGLPPFGNISTIASEENSLHENITVIEEMSELEPDSEATLYGGSQSQNNEQNHDHGLNRMETNETEPQTLEDSVNNHGPVPVVDEDDTQFDENNVESAQQEESSETEDILDEVENENSEEIGIEESTKMPGPDDDIEIDPVEKVYQLPISKIKRIMKTDPDTTIIGKEILVAVAISTENFISMLAQESFKLAVRSKKKRINLEHVKAAISANPAFDFLEGTLPEYEI